MRIRQVIILITFPLIIAGCNKWKKTSEYDFVADVVKSSAAHPYISITEGYITFDRFRFEGKRKKGGDVDFESDNPILINIVNSKMEPALSFDIPQGTYNEIETRVRIKNDTGDYSIIVMGDFDNGSQIIPIIFRYDDDVDFRNSINTQSVELKKEISGTVIMEFPVVNWFDPITFSMLNSANLTTINSVQTILITDSDNANLYDILEAQLENEWSLTFQ